MRMVILFGVVGLVLGLAAQMPRGPHSPSVPLKLVAAPPAIGAVDAEAATVGRNDSFVDHENSPLQLSGPERAERTGALELSSTSARDGVEQVLLLESEKHREAAFAEYRARQTVGALRAASRDEGQLRAELGETGYERYLVATGQPRRLVVSEVEPASPAANSGISPGDQILSYAGRRVFNLRDLNALMLSTTAGETVATTVVRDGQALQLYVTGGPLGLALVPN